MKTYENFSIFHQWMCFNDGPMPNGGKIIDQLFYVQKHEKVTSSHINCWMNYMDEWWI